VTVKIYYYEVFGKGSIKLNLNDCATVRDSLNELDKRFSAKLEEKTGRKLEEEALERRFNVFLNGTYLNLPYDLGRKLKDGDELVILRPVSGG
jgi:MoaD family protein